MLGPTAAHRRRARKEATALLATARRALARRSATLDEPVRANLAAAMRRTEDALAGGDHDAICEAMTVLADLGDRHLGFAGKTSLRAQAGSLGVVLAAALLLRAFVVEAFQIPSGSMIPTLQVGDHIFVSKLSYGVRLPFTTFKLVEWRKPARGEIVVFIHPAEPDKDLIKRVVAVEGDVVEVRDGLLRVNGQEVPHRELGEVTYSDRDEASDRWFRRAAHAEGETVAGRDYVTLHDGYRDGHDYPSRPGLCVAPGLRDARGDDGGLAPSGTGCVVQPGYVFAMGDNRDNSNDSRFWGAVPLGNIKGRAFVVWWSAGGPDGVRWKRLGHVIE